MTQTKRGINYVSLYGGRCGLTTDSKAAVLKREGTSNVQSVRPATEKEVAWVRHMGGEVPDGRIATSQHRAQA